MTQDNRERILELEEELLQTKSKVVDLEAKTKTTLSGGQFLVIVLIGPLFCQSVLLLIFLLKDLVA